MADWKYGTIGIVKLEIDISQFLNNYDLTISDITAATYEIKDVCCTETYVTKTDTDDLDITSNPLLVTFNSSDYDDLDEGGTYTNVVNVTVSGDSIELSAVDGVDRMLYVTPDCS